eukprot:122481_1
MLPFSTLLLLTNIRGADYDSYHFIGNAPNCTLQGCHQKSAGYSDTYPKWYSDREYQFCNDNVKCDNISDYTHQNTPSIMKACPLLSYLPTEYRSSGFVWSNNCSCPRWQCQHHIDKKSVYNEFTDLHFSRFPIQKICTNCSCEIWTDSYEYSKNNENNAYAWNCQKYSFSEPQEQSYRTPQYPNETFQCHPSFPTSLSPTSSSPGRRILNQSPTPSPTSLHCYNSVGTVVSDEETCQLNPMCTFSKLSITNTAKDICIVENYISPDINGAYRCYDTYQDEYISECPGCFKSSFSFPVFKYDCIDDVWVNETYTAEYIYFCCNDEWNCNINQLEDDCKMMKEPPTYIKYKTECDYSLTRIKNLYDITSDINFIRAAFCGTSLDYDEYKNDNQSLCDLMKVYVKYHTFCHCNLDRIRVANAIKNVDMDSAGLSSDYDEKQIGILQQVYINAIRTLSTNWYNFVYNSGYYWKLFAPHWGCNVDDDYFVCNVTQQYEKININFSVETTASPTKFYTTSKITKDDADCHVMSKLATSVIYIAILLMFSTIF